MRQLLLVPALVFFAAGCGQNSSEKPVPDVLQDRTAWRKLTKGMTQEKVRGLLGEPVRVDNEGEVSAWYYQEGPPLTRDEYGWVIGRGALLFSAKDRGSPKLTKWREP